MNKAIDRAFREAIEGGVFPSAELLVASNGETVF